MSSSIGKTHFCPNPLSTVFSEIMGGIPRLCIADSGTLPLTYLDISNQITPMLSMLQQDVSSNRIASSRFMAVRISDFSHTSQKDGTSRYLSFYVLELYVWLRFTPDRPSISTILWEPIETFLSMRMKALSK